MSEEKRQYQGHRHTSRRESAKKTSYPKKLAKQTVISAVILGVFVAAGNSDLTFFAQIQKLAKSAITYQFDSTEITGFFSKIFEFTQKPQLNSTEEKSNEDNTETEKTI